MAKACRELVQDVGGREGKERKQLEDKTKRAGKLRAGDIRWTENQLAAGMVALALARATISAKPSGSWMAISLSILRLRATPALARPSMKRL